MAHCPSCDYPLPEDPERTGARCPNCYDPLYEPPRRVGRPARPGEDQCPVHPGVETVGICKRCGNYLCEVCRSHWREYILCAACVERALQSREAAPEVERAHRRHAFLSLGLGVGIWVLLAVSFGVLALVAAMSDGPMLAGLLLVLSLGPGALLAIVGIGSGAAALRPRGSYMMLATGGLVLCCLYLGMVIGLFTFSLHAASLGAGAAHG